MRRFEPPARDLQADEQDKQSDHVCPPEFGNEGNGGGAAEPSLREAVRLTSTGYGWPGN